MLSLPRDNAGYKLLINFDFLLKLFAQISIKYDQSFVSDKKMLFLL